MLARGSSGAVVGWRRMLRKALYMLHSLTVPSSCALLGPNHPDIWVPKKNSSSDTHFSERHNWEFQGAKSNTAILGGESVAQDIKLKVAEEIDRIKSKIGKSPKLAVVLVCDRRDSQTFIRIKLKACEQVGIETSATLLPENCEEKVCLMFVANFNNDPAVHGIIVQLPLPQRHQATVSMVHAFTENPERITSEAEIVVADVGMPNIVRGNWLKQGVVVIDMGTNQVKNPNNQGFRITGDVCYEEAIKVASAHTPVPGGLGPVTISMLLSNSLDAAKRAFGLV